MAAKRKVKPQPFKKGKMVRPGFTPGSKDDPAKGGPGYDTSYDKKPAPIRGKKKGKVVQVKGTGMTGGSTGMTAGTKKEPMPKPKGSVGTLGTKKAPMPKPKGSVGIAGTKKAPMPKPKGKAGTKNPDIVKKVFSDGPKVNKKVFVDYAPGYGTNKANPKGKRVPPLSSARPVQNPGMPKPKIGESPRKKRPSGLSTRPPVQNPGMPKIPNTPGNKRPSARPLSGAKPVQNPGMPKISNTPRNRRRPSSGIKRGTIGGFRIR